MGQRPVSGLQMFERLWNHMVRSMPVTREQQRQVQAAQQGGVCKEKIERRQTQRYLNRARSVPW